MQRLSRLPTAPQVALLHRRKPKPLSWPHANTTFTQQTYIRWCCIDLSNAPRLSGVVLNVLFSILETISNSPIGTGNRNDLHCVSASTIDCGLAPRPRLPFPRVRLWPSQVSRPMRKR